MAPLTPEQKTTVKKAWIGLVSAVVFIAAALSCNRPSEKTIDFDLDCGQFVVPARMSLNLNTPQAQVRKLTLFGFEAKVSNVVSGTMQADNGPEQKIRNGAVTLAVSPDESTAVTNLSITPSGNYGTMELSADPGMVLVSPVRVDSPLSFTIKRPNKAEGTAGLVLQSGGAIITGQRFVVGASAPPVFMNLVTMKVSGAPSVTTMELNAGAAHPQQLRADITFDKADEDVVMLGDEPGKTVTLHDATLTFTRVFNPNLRIDGLKPKELIADHTVDIVVKLLSGKIQTLGVVGMPTKESPAGLHISGSAEASSVLQDGHELLPTWVEETLDKPYTERSTRLVILGMLGFVLFKVVDRALDLLLKFFTPED